MSEQQAEQKTYKISSPESRKRFKDLLAEHADAIAQRGTKVTAGTKAPQTKRIEAAESALMVAGAAMGTLDPGTDTVIAVAPFVDPVTFALTFPETYDFIHWSRPEDVRTSYSLSEDEVNANIRQRWGVWTNRQHFPAQTVVNAVEKSNGDQWGLSQLLKYSTEPKHPCKIDASMLALILADSELPKAVRDRASACESRPDPEPDAQPDADNDAPQTDA